MSILVLGASGATGKLLVEQLLKVGQLIKILVRPSSNFPENWKDNKNITIIPTEISALSIDEMAKHLADCEAVASCLGHNLSMKGMYGKPRKLVTDTMELICKAININQPISPVKVVLMNTAGNSNRKEKEPVSIGQKIVIGLIRFLVPPHADNEKAADYLSFKVGRGNPYIEWAVVRPDTLTNEEKVSEYTAHNSPTRSAIFNAGKTSRINVAHFMAQLITEDTTWKKWKGKMPVIYNQTEPVEKLA